MQQSVDSGRGLNMGGKICNLEQSGLKVRAAAVAVAVVCCLCVTNCYVALLC